MIGPVDLFRETSLAPVFAGLGLVAVDVGARGGIVADLAPIAFAVDVVGFEPDPEAFRRLSANDAKAGSWRSVRYLPSAVAGRAGMHTLRVPTDPVGASLLAPIAEWGERLAKPQFFDVVREIQVECQTLDGVLAAAGIAAPAFLKLDVEGAEMNILDAAPMAIESLSAVKVEVAFLPFREGQASMSHIDAFLRAHGFIPFDFFDLAHWRRADTVVHPHAGTGDVPYSRGQIVHGDVLYVRDPKLAMADDPASALRIAAILLAYGYFDAATEIFDAPAVDAWLVERHGLARPDVARAVAGASRRYGRWAWRRALTAHLRGLVPFVRSAARLWP